MKPVTDWAKIDELARQLASAAAQLQGLAPKDSVTLALANVGLYVGLEMRKESTRKLKRSKTTSVWP